MDSSKLKTFMFPVTMTREDTKEYTVWEEHGFDSMEEMKHYAKELFPEAVEKQSKTELIRSLFEKGIESRLLGLIINLGVFNILDILRKDALRDQLRDAIRHIPGISDDASIEARQIRVDASATLENIVEAIIRDIEKDGEE